MKIDKQYLIDMLPYARPDGGKEAAKWMKRFVAPVAKKYAASTRVDATGNWIVTVGQNPRQLFSSHYDTAHRPTHIYPKGYVYIPGKPCTGIVTVPARDGLIQIAHDTARDEIVSACGQPIGADDAVGVWIMLAMLQAKIPGTYIFHAGEECGGKGSSYIAANDLALLARHTHAIAFDRGGSADVITEQARCGRCASDHFAHVLSHELNRHGTGLRYRPSDEGVFTDTANYADAIAECTNISVGYANEHTAHEVQSLGHAVRLLDAILAIDWSALPVDRDPYDPPGPPGWDDWRDYGRRGAYDYLPPVQPGNRKRRKRR